jgi:hypothetical protein
VIFNIAGLVILLAGFGSIYVLAFLFPKSEWNPLYLIVLVWIGLDLLYRASFPEFRFFDPDQGGHIFYVPLWVLGVALAVYSILEKSKLKRRAMNRQADSDLDMKETAVEPDSRPAETSAGEQASEECTRSSRLSRSPIGAQGRAMVDPAQ